jgi:hypothetical protein
MSNTPATVSFSIALLASASAFAAGAPLTDSGYSRTVLIEAGHTAPALDLNLFFDEVQGSLQQETAAVEVFSGKAALSKQGELTQSRPSVGSIPEIHSFAVHEESRVRIQTSHGTVISRVVTVPAGGISGIKAYFGEASPGVIALGQHHAVVDESKLQVDDNSGTARRIDSVGSTGFGKGLSRALPRATPPSTNDICIRTPLGPGVVNWTIPNPSGPEWLYSVKPETSTALVRAAAPSQDIDGVYRYYWGCGIALKVPDSCTLTINNGSASACCNAAMELLGHTVQWVNPSAIGWVNCPL